jgi:hypothetical protein
MSESRKPMPNAPKKSPTPGTIAFAALAAGFVAWGVIVGLHTCR